MLGVIIGDIVGSIYEFNNIKTKDFLLFDNRCIFTDDTVMSLAVSESLIMCNKNYKNYQSILIKNMQKFYKDYPDLSYGDKFKFWLLSSDPKPYNSSGNGSAMKVAPVAYFGKNLEEVGFLAEQTAAVSHNHPDGIKGARAVAEAVYLALIGKDKNQIKSYIEEHYYSLNFDYEELKKNYKFDATCQGTVPQAIYCFLISENFEDAIRTGVSIGGDCDTLCAITGAIAEAFYGIPESLKTQALNYLDKNLLKKFANFSKKSTFFNFFSKKTGKKL